MSVEDERKLYNSYVLKQHDPCLDHLIFQSSIGEVYSYTLQSDHWAQLHCKGTVFLYSRIAQDGCPYGLLVLNREGAKDFYLGISPARQSAARGVLPMEADLQKNTVLVQASADCTYGIWLFEEADRSRLASLLQWCITHGQG